MKPRLWSLVFIAMLTLGGCAAGSGMDGQSGEEMEDDGNSY